jgi:hypothetical protein
VSNVDFHNNALIGKEDNWDSLLKFDKPVTAFSPVEKEPDSVEKDNGPPKIDCLLGSGRGSDSLTLEHETKDKIIITYKKRIIEETYNYKRFRLIFIIIIRETQI